MLDKNLIKKIGALALKLRNDKKVSRRIVSEKTGLSEPTIERIEAGLHSSAVDAIKMIANYHGMTMSEFFKKAGD